MRQPDLDLLHAYLDDRLSTADCEALQSLLRESPEARRVLRGLATIDTKLEQLAAADPHCLRLLMPGTQGPWSATSEVRQTHSGSRSLAAIAGLFLGVCCTSIVFAYAVIPVKARTIFFESFEHGQPPLTAGMPIRPGVWGGDYTKVVEADERVTPADGRGMLRFLRADHEGKPPRFGFVSEIYRIIDLGDFTADIAEGYDRLVAEVRFASLDHDQPNRYLCNVKLDTMAALPSTGGEREVKNILDAERLEIKAIDRAIDHFGSYSPASVDQSLTFRNTGERWQTLRVELSVSPGTRYVLVKLSVADLQAAAEGRDSCDVEFPGQFVDDVRIFLVRNPVR